MDILGKITKLRLERNWTEYQLAEKAGLTQSTISSWYRKNLIPSIPSLEHICTAFNLTLSQFFNEDENSIIINESQKNVLVQINKLEENQQQLLFELLKSFEK